MLRSVIAAAAVLLGLVVPAGAGAWEAPGQRPADAAVTQLAGSALAFWRAHGLTSCPQGVTVWQAPTLATGDGPAWGLGDGSTCEAWVADDLAGLIVFPDIGWGWATKACTALTHEVGHALGLPHSTRGVMAGGEARPPYPQAWAPPFCKRWARATRRAVLRGEGYTDRELRGWDLS